MKSKYNHKAKELNESEREELIRLRAEKYKILKLIKKETEKI